MNSFQISNHCENNANVSQCSGDLFQESPQLECNIQSSFISDIKFSNEKSSETSDELCFTPRRKPRRALSLSHDSSQCYSRNSSDSLRNDLNTDPSKFFQPISPLCNINKVGSSSLLEDHRSSSSEVCRTPELSHLSKENVAVISFVSESAHSDSSSILDDSQKSENGNQNSKHFFRTPLCSSVKKRTIRQWLNNVSLNCSLKPHETVSYNRGEVVAVESDLSDIYDSKPISLNVLIASSVEKDNVHDKTYVKKLEDLRVSGTGNSSDCKIERGNTTENYCPSLFDSFEDRRREHSMSQHEGNHFYESYKYSNEVSDQNTCHKSSNKSITFKPHFKITKSFESSCPEDSENHVSKRDNRSVSFNKSSRNYKSDESNFSSADDSDSTFNNICNNNPSNIVDSDDSFTKMRLFKKKKKKNCLNISSDDSEAKDTANESEDIPRHNSELFTPKRRLYFRNPLNNSLDDDANPVTYNKDNGNGKDICSKDNGPQVEKIDRTTGLLDQINSEVQNLTINSPNLKNQDIVNDNEILSDKGHNVKLKSKLLNKSLVPGMDHSFIQPSNELNESVDTLSPHKPNSFQHLHSSPGNQDDLNQINLSRLSINRTSKNIYVDNSNIQINNSNKDDSESIEEPQINEGLDSSNQLPSNLDESSDSIVKVTRKSKKNLNFSSDNDSFRSENPNTNIIDVNEVSDSKPSPSVDLTKSDDEYDKYMYRTRSDSSFSDNEEISSIPKDSSEVISVHTTTSEEEEDDENSPWFDLESYLKKNIPASSKSFDSSFSKNSEKRKARLAKISLPTHSICPNHTSFLLSLTPEVPDEMCHPEAVKYRGESFSKHKNELVDLLFKLYNKEIFDEKLPPLEIKWSGHLTTTSGITKSSSKITKNGKIRNSIIKLSKTVVDDASKVRDVLLHELCHAANWLIDEKAGGHGPLFKKWVNKIWIKFPEVPKVKTTHHYELKWKYLYKCSYCGYELGKMKLSLNETSCRLCGGLVTVNT